MPVASCFLCGASFGVSTSLNRHLKEVHNHENVQKEKCFQCEYVGKHRNLTVKNGCDKFLYTFLEYENNLYIK